MAKSSKKYHVTLSNGVTYEAPTLPEADRVFCFLRSAFPDLLVNLNVHLK